MKTSVGVFKRRHEVFSRSLQQEKSIGVHKEIITYEIMHSFSGTQSRKLVEAHKKRFMKKPPLRTALDDLASQERKEKENMDKRDSSTVTTDDEPPIRAPSKLVKTVSTNYSTDSSVDDNFRRPCPTGSVKLKKAKYLLEVKGSSPLDVQAKVPGTNAEESKSEEGEMSGHRETKGTGEKRSPILFSSRESKDISIPLSGFVTEKSNHLHFKYLSI